MALNSPSNLSLGQLGHIAGGKANTTTQTSLAGDCRGSSASTAMWADFRIGNTGMTLDSGVFDGEARGYFRIIVRNDVGEYMGGTSGGENVTTSLVSSINGDNSYIYHIDETSDGSLYESRIAQNSDNTADYLGSFSLYSGSAGFAIQMIYSDEDKCKFFGI